MQRFYRRYVHLLLWCCINKQIGVLRKSLPFSKLLSTFSLMKKDCIIYIALLFLLLTLSAACAESSGVSRSEFTGLEGRVSTLENIVVGRESAKLPGTALGVGGSSGAVSSGAAVVGAADSQCGTYNQGLSYVRQKQYAKAAGIFQNMLAVNPQGKLAPNARYWLGECSYATGRYQEALAEFARCAEDYPNSGKAPDSMLKMSYCYDRLGDGGRAMAVMALLLQKYPNSSAAQMVKDGRSRFKS